MLFNHSVRVYVFGAMKGFRENLKFDPELLYVAALFHDMGLVDAYHTDSKRLKSMALTPRANSSEVTASPMLRRIWFGTQLRSISRPAFHYICDQKLN
jgi:HD superfamily phosphodiesterase